MVPQLINFALTALPRMYQKPQRLFCFKVLERDGQLVPVDVSFRYTAMTIVGLKTAAKNAHEIPFDLAALLDGLIANVNDTLPLGDLGLTIWAAGAVDPGRAKTIVEMARRRTGEWPSMHLQWLLTGLCEIGDQEFAADIYRRLESRRVPATGMFYFGAERKPACYFAEQVYGMQALHRYSKLTGESAPAAAAQQLADTICSRQRPNGGWPWIYDPRTAAVLDVYPVYSVHQLGMGPMALLPLGRQKEVERGIAWEFGENELGRSLYDEKRGVIWRSIKARHFPRQRQLIHKLRAAIGPVPADNQPGIPRQFAIDMEARPYELGWLLEALSGYRPQ